MYSPYDVRHAYPSRHTKAEGKFTPQICHNHKPAISSRHSIPYTFYRASPTLRTPKCMYSPYDVRHAYPSRHTKAEGKFTPQICRSRIFVPANECTRVVPMYPSQSQSAMSHLHSLAQSMYIATFLPEHVLTTCFADYVTSTSGATRLAFDLLPLASSLGCVFGDGAAKERTVVASNAQQLGQRGFTCCNEIGQLCFEPLPNSGTGLFKVYILIIYIGIWF